MKAGAVEKERRRLGARWRRRRFWFSTFLVGCTVCLQFFLLGVAVLFGFVDDLDRAAWYSRQILGWSALAWIALTIFVFVRRPSTAWLDAILEEAEPGLLDRLHSLRFLDRGPAAPPSFRDRIERGAAEVLAQRRGRVPLPRSGAAASLTALVLSAAGTLYFYQKLQPWEVLHQRMRAAESEQAAKSAPETAEMAEVVTVEQRQPWGEVRITAPGRDLRVTKADAVPLEIQAAADRALESIAWFDAVNGAAETVHRLPPPGEPRFAAYKPVLYLEEIGVSDWDVVTYYAKAETTGGHTYASEVYFLEVLPPQDEIAQVSGGQGARADRLLSALSHLIARQRHVIRETHRHAQRPPGTEVQRRQERRKLAAAEVELRDAVSHLYAQLTEELAGAPVDSVLDHLARAEAWLDKAAFSLNAANLGEAQERERAALKELSETRKDLYRAIAEHPEGLAGRERKRTGPEADALAEIAEYRDGAAAARAFTGQALARQKSITARARRALADAALAAEQQRLARELESFAINHPAAFAALAETESARAALAEAEQTMRSTPEMSVVASRKAEAALSELERAVTEKMPHRLLRDAYRLKRLLDQEIERLERLGPRPPAENELRQRGEAALRIVRELKKLAASAPVRDAFGPRLHEALRDLSALEAAATALSRSSGDPEEQLRALAAGLLSLSGAFGASVPALLEAQPDGLLDGDAGGSADTTEAQMTNLDPARFPPEYRQPIEAYFKKLSETGGE
jgi:hypothetical protein